MECSGLQACHLAPQIKDHKLQRKYGNSSHAVYFHLQIVMGDVYILVLLAFQYDAYLQSGLLHQKSD